MIDWHIFQMASNDTRYSRHRSNDPNPLSPPPAYDEHLPRLGRARSEVRVSSLYSPIKIFLIYLHDLISIQSQQQQQLQPHLLGQLYLTNFS